MQDMATQGLSLFFDSVKSFDNKENTDALVDHLLQAFQPNVTNTAPVILTSKDTKEDDGKQT